MRVSYKWLGDYVDLGGVSASELGDRLTMVGLEVEEIHDRYEYLDTVVAAVVETVEPHPKSDHLFICRVQTGEAEYQVVCGAPNTRAGMVSAMALPGTVLPGGMKVGQAEIRGATSSGMLCSEAELMVGSDASGIMDLPGSTPTGTGLKQVLGLEDWVFEIGITPNRPDCLSVLGVAREVAGILKKPLTYPSFELIESEGDINDVTSVKIFAPEHCPRYTARVIKGVKIGPSPFWMQDRLIAAGVRPISNIVDITNFVLMETGQPLHAFDLHSLDEERIEVRVAEPGSTFTTLDGTDRKMGDEMLMICDGKKPVGLAGIMGGLNSEIGDETEDVLLESAYFSPVSIRRTSKGLGLSTEASFRYERGIDPDVCVFASTRASAMMAELAGGRVLTGLIDENPIPHKIAHVRFSPSKCNAFLGTDFSQKEMKTALEAIGLKALSEGDDEIEIQIPTFRVDLERPVDIYEEVARHCGFDRVPPTIPEATGEPRLPSPSRTLRAVLRDVLEGRGLCEIVSYSFIGEKFPDKLNLPEGDRRRNVVRILNPLSEEQALMRTSLAPSLFEALERNRSRGVRDVAIYEIGRAYFAVEGQELADERWTVAGVLAGFRDELSWHRKPEPVDFYDVKGVVEDVLDAINVPAPAFEPEEKEPFLSPKASARVSSGGITLGLIGRVAPTVLDAYGLKEDAYYFELDVDALLEARVEAPQFQPLDRFPGVERDLALVLDRTVPAADVRGYIGGLDEPLLSGVSIFDVYEGQQVENDKRSLAFRLTYRSSERTLTDEEVNEVHERITGRVLERFSARLRS